MKGNAIDDGDEQEGPMRSTFCLGDVAAVVYREEDVGRVIEIWQDFLEGEGLGRLPKHVGHGWTQEDDGGFGVSAQLFALEILLPEGDCL